MDWGWVHFLKMRTRFLKGGREITKCGCGKQKHGRGFVEDGVDKGH